jgi:2-keto-4-pentenoate hydratase/2-oxohepta-3-ene-1,7-dioic acid hydratase in catechol pathway
MGLVLTSDYTDRAALMRHVNLRDVSSGDGFTRGKSEPGFMPTGNLFVIPKDYLSFYKKLKLELWYNRDKRQEAHPKALIWDIRRMIAESFVREGRSWIWNGKPVALPFKDGRIQARTMFLSGTPGGVIYQKPSARQMFVGISALFFSLHWSQLQTVVEPFLREEYQSGRYLKTGDFVQMRADRLGTISNHIVAQ